MSRKHINLHPYKHRTMAAVKELISGTLERAVLYFNGLTNFQQYAWIAIAAGVVFLILALILW